MLRCKAQGQVVTLRNVNFSDPLSSLAERIATELDVPAARQKLLVGFPPSLVDKDGTTPLSECGIQRGDTVLVEVKDVDDLTPVTSSEPAPVVKSLDQSLGSPKTTPSRPPAFAPVGRMDVGGGSVVRRPVASDNSCLFTSIAYVLEGRDLSKASHLRTVVADTIAADPTTYSSAVLAKEPADYVKWIISPTSWGGGIELSILSNHYRVEISAMDIQTLRYDVYGSNMKYQHRCYLIYDGIHYDPLAFTFSPECPPDSDITVFNPEDEYVFNLAKVVAKEAKEKRQFTDTSGFTLRCLVCQQGLVGEKGATQHAMETSHTNFAEF
eukprot:TRINITY_DN17331_c0_g1_i1.p1 TRINITY_DN17331_c0_g1~~TRINITY_DN17331_c0_g1_i1.p1  ORF type:complete len:325 (+),score=39.74 TRINITY_DN17331_c0_g1_i1:260-1234(+)